MVYWLLFGGARNLLDAVIRVFAWATIAIIVAILLGYDPIAATQSFLTDLVNLLS